MKIKTKIALIIAVSQIILLLVIIYTVTSFSGKVLVEKEINKAEDIVNLYSQLCMEPLQRMDYYSLEVNTKKVFEIENVIFAEVTDSNHFSIAKHSSKRENSKKFVKKFQRKIISPQNKILGYAVITHSTESIYNTINQIRKILSSLIILSTIILAVILIFIFNRIVSVPIDKLLEIVQKITDKKFSIKVPKFADDEIGKLAESINIMVGKINKYQKDLKKTENFLKNTIHSISNPLISVDNDYNIIHSNNAAREYFGIKESDKNENLWLLIPFLNEFKSDFDNYKIKSDYGFLRKEKIENFYNRFLNIHFNPMKLEDFNGAVILFEDVTDEVAHEKQLIEAQKMEAVGTMAAGVAHDLKNILSVVTAKIEIIKFMIKNGKINIENLKKHLNILESENNKSLEVTKQFFNLSKKRDDLILKKIDLNNVLENLDKIIDTFDSQVSFELKTLPYKAITNADMSMIEQILLNLVMNAQDALTIMKDDPEKYGGNVSISLSDLILENPVKNELLPEADDCRYWLLEIKDNGVGISQEAQKKIFEPFYSSKKEQGGTGLGLLMTLNIVNLHRGFIKVHSKIGIGTCFKIYLPKIDSYKNEFKLEKSSNKSILIFSNNPKNLKLYSYYLKKFDLDIFTCSDLGNAQKLLENKINKIDNCLVDVDNFSMNDINNIEQTFNTSKIIYCSDFPYKNNLFLKEDDFKIKFISKPICTVQNMKNIEIFLFKN